MPSFTQVQPARDRKRDERPSVCRSISIVILMLLLSILVFIVPVSRAADSPYRSVTGPCNLVFPADHGPHTDYRTEWWYYTGNLRSDRGEPFGFQLTFFRHRIAPPGFEKEWPDHPSMWRTFDLFFVHAAISDIQGKTFLHADASARAALQLAGASTQGDETTVWIRNWSAVIDSGRHALAADAGSFKIDLALTPLKPATLHGELGYSRKGAAPDSASCYYSFTRLKTGGVLTIGGDPHPVHGDAWMDHEFGSAPLEPGIVGWDWFSLQLSDDTELMVYLLRRKDGTWIPASSGTFVEATGETRHLSADMIEVKVEDHWESPHSRATYPSRWKIAIPSLRMDLLVTPNLEDQEMSTPLTTGVTYWEGSVSTRGRGRDGKEIAGTGYVELTGYAAAIDSRF